MNPAEFLSLLRARHCQRAFTSEPVSRETLQDILLAAGQAPSGKNTQPWRVTVVSGAKRDDLSKALCAAYDAGEKPRPDYEYSLQPEPEEWRERARSCGYSLFELKGIARRTGWSQTIPAADPGRHERPQPGSFLLAGQVCQDLR